MNSKVRALFFDAGNTLVFPKVDGLVEAVRQLGYPAEVEDFYESERLGKRSLDEWLWPQIRSGNIPAGVDSFYWIDFLTRLVERLKVPQQERARVAEQLGEDYKKIEVWTRVFPGTAEYLARLKDHGYYLAVISNSMGRMEELMNDVGLAKHLSFVFDSAIVGVEKPHPHIFQMALEKSGMSAAESVFVGDVYSTDIGGARGAGIEGVLIDWVGAYPEVECRRITSIGELDGVIEQLNDSRAEEH
ncbi:MAG TPA: HAD-IA family hydrolase [Terriglobia bacterium]|nr:HAD-IA family hydrolase [Terriglobia bacterium]